MTNNHHLQTLPKLIATDIDGTVFVHATQSILPRTYQVLTDCIEKGSFLVPVTGRILSMVPLERFPKVRYVISSNGALITDEKEHKILRAKHINKKDIETFWCAVKDIVREHAIAMEMFEDGRLVVEQSLYDNLPSYQGLLPTFHYRQIESENAKFVSSFDDYLREEGTCVVKVNFPGETVKNFPCIKEIAKNLGLFTINSDKYNVECGPKGCNKGEAILWLCDYLNIPHESTIAFGDANNDLEMLGSVQYGVAMGNALEEVKKTAAYTTLSNEEDGIAEFLEKNFL